MILEEAGNAKQRGVAGYAEVAGFGAGHSLPNYEEAGATGGVDEGYAGAIERALEDAGVKAEQIDAVFPLGSAAALQVAAAARAIREQVLPPALVGGVRPQAAGKAKLEHVLVCTGALGGQNAAAVLRRVER